MGVSKKRYRGISFLDQVFLFPFFERSRNKSLFFSGVSLKSFFKSPNLCLQSPLTCITMTNIGQKSIRITLNSKSATILVQGITFLIINDI